MSQKDQIIQYLIMFPGRHLDTWKCIELFHCTTFCQRKPEIVEYFRRHPFISEGITYKLAEGMFPNTEQGEHLEIWLSPVKVPELQGVLF